MTAGIQLDAELQAIRQKIAAEEDRVNGIEQGIAELNESVETIATSVVSLNDRIADLAERVTTLEGETDIQPPAKAAPMPFGTSRLSQLSPAARDATTASRTYSSGLPQSWADHGASKDPHRPGFVHFLSIKTDPDNPDWNKLTTFMASVNEVAASYPEEEFVVSIWHEPEDNIASGQFSASGFRNLHIGFHDITASFDRPNLKTSVTLMEWTFRQASGRNPMDYIGWHEDGTPALDVLGIDPYDPNANTELIDLVAPINNWMIESLGNTVELSVAEFGTHTPTHLAPSNGKDKVWDGPVRTEADGLRWLQDGLTEVASLNVHSAIWFHSWVGSKGPWWLPELGQEWLSEDNGLISRQ